ncbi:Pectinesterase inhibitor domain containing protein [Thalictrum thalictroides]|uniref:Pectinesterase inhibitor domain containing protein n=1 Tax=Thalictrum thalictroides TaxID=46969 RepID=A0A7J6X931_THATH|nr:Pectinesterase inhibitor domain containing protein [Thalictrum thalictroides]
MHNNLLVFFLFIITYLGCPLARVLLGVSDLVLTTCSHTLYCNLCLSSLQSDPRSGTADLKGLAVVALDICNAHAAHMISHVNELKSQKNTTYPPYIFSCLNDCINEYQEATGNLEEAAQALNNNSYSSVNAFTTAAMTDSDTCEDGCSDNHEYKSPLTLKNQHFFELCSNALAITNLLG